MALADLRRKVIFHNSIDVWIESCHDAGVDWSSVAGYMRFIAHLRQSGLNLKTFNLCSHEAGAVEREKTDFADALRALKDPNAATYTIKLSDAALESVRRFHQK